MPYRSQKVQNTHIERNILKKNKKKWLKHFVNFKTMLIFAHALKQMLFINF